MRLRRPRPPPIAGAASQQDALREAALRLFTTDPTVGLEDAGPTTTPASGKATKGKKTAKKKPAPAKKPAK